MTFPDVRGPQTSVLCGGGQIGFDLPILGGLVEQFLQKRPAPAAAGTRAKTFAQLAYAPGPLHSNKIHYLPPRDVKAKAKFFVHFHRSPRTGRDGPGTGDSPPAARRHSGE